MSSLHPARRSAERFNSLLQGEQEAARDPRDAGLLEVVGALQTLPRVEARPEFVADLRERLLLAAETDLVAGAASETLDERLTVRSRRTPRERRLAIALGGFAIIGATTSMAVAAQSALPGDVLYPLKRAIENAQTGINISDDAKGNAILGNASDRLDEVDELTQQDEVDADAVSQTLGTFAEQAEQASDLLIADYNATGSEDSINGLRDFTAASIQVLADLEEIVPPGAEQALLDAAQVLFEIDSLAANLCPLCESPGITEIPVPLLASGDTRLDDAAVEAGQDGPATATPPDKGGKPDQGGKGPVISATEPPTDPIQLPTPSAGNGATGGGNGGPKNPVGSGGASVSVSVPPVGVPEVDAIVSDVVEGVDQVLGGLTGQSTP